MSDSESHVEFQGEVINCGKGGYFVVRITDDHTVVCKLSGKMRKNKIRVVLADKVTVSASPYDFTKGFITLRAK
jgi:translation initiation factor IF-1